ncbi:unnamed protein product [marine sediment metagenome]|uniref:Uncharacterized protein n=1 Tax=marine sediment metagenome TaxID=412755 RepID=X1JJ35_9ZZZZ
MVMPASRRIQKYAAKIDGDVFKNRYDATRDMSITSEETYQPLAEALENAVKTAIDGERAIYIPYYIIFGKQVQKALNNHTTATSQLEIDNAHAIWLLRGLVGATLDLVEAAVKAL